MSRTPQLLSSFPCSVDMAVLHAFEKGKLVITFHTAKEAQSKKFEFYRFFRAVNYYNPNIELVRAVNGLMIRIDDRKLELVRKDAQPSNDAIMQAIAESKAGVESHLDEVAATLARLNDEPLINPSKE